jgi:adenylylsulfate kinase
MVDNIVGKDDGQAVCLWLMGPTSSGKTTLAEAFVDHLRQSGEKNIIHYDGDEVRDFYGPSLGFDSEDRMRVVKTLVHLTNKAMDIGINVIVSALTAHVDARQYISNQINPLIIVAINCDVEECARRDPKGLYKQAQQGEITTLIGVNSRYLPPESPDIVIDTGSQDVDASLDQLIGSVEYLKL